jgi:hypothetical protein
MFSKSTIIAASVAVASAAISKDAGVSHSTTLGCSQCLQGGFVYCVNTGWFQDITPKTGEPIGFCCENTAGCQKQYDKNYACSQYRTGGRYLDAENSKMPTGFGSNIAYPLAACPTTQKTCGTKFIELEKPANTYQISF